jgi:hypothetical protein
MVLLNLAFIPDDVVKNIENFEFGWSSKFKQLMNAHWNDEKFIGWNKKLDEAFE